MAEAYENSTQHTMRPGGGSCVSESSVPWGLFRQTRKCCPQGHSQNGFSEGPGGWAEQDELTTEGAWGMGGGIFLWVTGREPRRAR